MPMGPDPSKYKHANQIHGLPWNDNQGKGLMRGSHFLEDKNNIRTLIGPEQDMHAISSSVTDDRTTWTPDCYPKTWLRPGSVLRPPRVVILSAYLAWSEMWNDCVFGANMQGSSSSVPWKYSDISQWNVKPNLKSRESSPPDWDTEVASSVICKAKNNMLQEYQDLKAAFRVAADILAQQQIIAIIPEWGPDEFYMAPNTLMKDIVEPLNPPIYRNAWPRYSYTPTPYSFWYLDDQAEDYKFKIKYSGTPSLACPYPGFGTNILHLYCGHFARRKIESGDVKDWVSWRSGTFGFQNEDRIIGTYVNNPDVTSAELGIRDTWKPDSPYGYLNGSNLSSWDLSPETKLIYDNWYKYRNWQTKFFAFNESLDFGKWDFDIVWNGRLSYDESIFWSTAFPGATFCQSPEGRCNEDSIYLGPGITLDDEGNEVVIGDNTSPLGGIGMASHRFFIPTAEGIRLGIDKLKITKGRIEDFYGGLSGGTLNFFQDVLTWYGLEDYGFEVGGLIPTNFMDGELLAQYVIDYFDSQS